MIYTSADSEDSGIINRVELKEAIIANMDKVSIITDFFNPSNEAVIDQVMKLLDESSSGIIYK